jgi:hypothetical protein
MIIIVIWRMLQNAQPKVEKIRNKQTKRSFGFEKMGSSKWKV